MGKTMGIHDGHRDRMRERFLQNGLESFNEIEALELLLYYAIPRRDTNPIAHALLERFGSLYYVFDASEEELCEVPDISRRTAALIKLVPQMVKVSEINNASQIKEIKTTQDAVDFLLPRFRYEKDEIMVLLCLDTQKRIIHSEVISRGIVNAVSFDTRRLVEIALKRKAAFVIIAHNHPNGPPLPSKEDDSTTSLVYRALSTVSIGLYDHIIVAGDEYASYRRSGALDLYRYGY